jgi:hypothetical protein
MTPVPRTFAFNFGVSSHSLWEGGGKCRHMKGIDCYGGWGGGWKEEGSLGGRGDMVCLGKGRRELAGCSNFKRIPIC